MERNKNVTRLYSGNAPSIEWECVEVFTSDALVWHLYRAGEIKDSWWNFKLVAASQAPNKANYWFAWNGKRTNNSKDWRSMEDHRPELQASVYSYLKQELDV